MSTRAWPLAALVAASLLSAPARAEVEPGAEATDAASGTLAAGPYLAGRYAGSVRDLDAAAGFFRDALSEDPDSPELLERAFLLVLAAGEVEEGLALADELIALDDTHRLARLALAVDAVKDGRFDVARGHAAEANTGPLADLTATLITAWAQAGEGDHAGAFATLDALEGPQWYRLFQDYHAGMIAELAGDDAEAARRYESAYRLDASSIRMVETYIRFQARTGETEKAQAALATIREAAPNNPLVEALVGELESGAALQPLVTTAQAGVAEALYGLGSALGREGGEDVAALYLELALHLVSNEPLIELALGDLYRSLDQHEAAIAHYDLVPPDSILRHSAQIQGAFSLSELERPEEAMQRLELLLEGDPSNLEAIYALGNLLRVGDRFEESAEVYSRAVEQIEEPAREHWTVFYFRGIAYERSKQWAKAEADFQQALKLFPEQPLVLNYLGYSWVDQGLHLDEALGMIRRAVELRPDDGYIIDSLGWAFYRLGRYDEAVTELERAVELRPQDPVLNDHLGDAYWMVGRRLEARFQWSHARDLDPEPEDLTKIVDKLANGLREPEENAAAR